MQGGDGHVPVPVEDQMLGAVAQQPHVRDAVPLVGSVPILPVGLGGVLHLERDLLPAWEGHQNVCHPFPVPIGTSRAAWHSGYLVRTQCSSINFAWVCHMDSAA